MLSEYRRRVGAASFDLCFRGSTCSSRPWRAMAFAYRERASTLRRTSLVNRTRRFAARTVWTRATLLVLRGCGRAQLLTTQSSRQPSSRTYECCGQSKAHLELPAAVVQCARPTRTYEELLHCWLAACKTLASKQPSVPTRVRPRKEISTRCTKYRSIRIDTSGVKAKIGGPSLCTAGPPPGPKRSHWKTTIAYTTN